MLPTLKLQPVVLMIGNYGTGKTEVSINLAQHFISQGSKVQVADLDVVNPYFRSREVREILESQGIEVLVPEDRLLEADLPVVIPQIQGAIRAPKGLAILDVGGDDVGATVLGSMHDALEESPHDLLQVVNVKRPLVDTVEGSLRITKEIEEACRLRITGIVGNSHLMDETDHQTILEGYEHARQVAEALDVPLRFITVDKKLLETIDISKFECPVLPIERQLLPPWRRRNKLGHRNFLL